MDVEQKIKDIIATIPGLNYEFNDWTRANVTLDNLPLPTCLYILPVSGQLFSKYGIIKDYPNTMIAFLDKAKFDFDGEENDVTVERMKGFAVQFIDAVNKSMIFEPIDGAVNYTVPYDILDVNLTGVIIEIQLKELEGVCLR